MVAVRREVVKGSQKTEKGLTYTALEVVYTGHYIFVPQGAFEGRREGGSMVRRY